jgi:uncharacterized protein YegJ (DUF2314 family)
MSKRSGIVLAFAALLGGVLVYGPLTGSAPRLSLFRQRRPEAALRIPLPASHQLSFVVYFRPQGRSLPTGRELRSVARRWLDRHAPQEWRAPLRKVVAGKLLQIHVGTKKSFPPPSLHRLEHAKTGTEELQRLKAATHIAVISVDDHPGRPPYPGLWSAIATSRAVADTLSGVILDPALAHVLPVSSHAERLPVDMRLRITEHIVISYSVDERGLGWMTTEGMSKFGLPELQIKEYPPDLSQDLGAVINGLGQHLLSVLASQAGSKHPSNELQLGPEVRLALKELAAAGERPPLPRTKDARGWTTVRLRHEPGQADETPFLTLTPPRDFEGEHGVWLHSLSTDLFGGEDPKHIRNISSDSPAMIAARDRAAKALPAVKRRFQAGLRPGETLTVKHGFPTRNGGHEYMWIVVNTWKGSLLTGQLANDPQLRTDLRPGQKIYLYDSDVIDWMLSFPDGRTEGNFTGAVATAEGQAYR